MSKIEKSAVTLTIWGQSIQPDEITRLLGCSPTQAAQTGDVLTLSTGKTRQVPCGFWKLEYPSIDAVEINQKIDHLLRQLSNDTVIWEQIADRYRLELFCGLFVGAWNEGFTLSAELVQQLGRRHIQLGFDVYAPVDSWYADVADGPQYRPESPEKAHRGSQTA